MKTYLGDGAFASFDGYSIRIYTSDGIHDTNEIFFDGEVLQAFLDFAEQVKEASK